MAERRGEVVNKSRLCVLTGRSRPLIDRWIIEGCPVVEAAKDKGGEWKFNTAAVFDWLEQGRIDRAAQRVRARFLHRSSK